MPPFTPFQTHPTAVRTPRCRSSASNNGSSRATAVKDPNDLPHYRVERQQFGEIRSMSPVQ